MGSCWAPAKHEPGMCPHGAAQAALSKAEQGALAGGFPAPAGITWARHRHGRVSLAKSHGGGGGVTEAPVLCEVAAGAGSAEAGEEGF